MDACHETYRHSSNANWVVAARHEFRKIAYQFGPEVMVRWPLILGCRFEAYWAGDGLAALALRNVDLEVRQMGPARPASPPAGLEELASPLNVEGTRTWVSRFVERVAIGPKDAVIVVPIYPGNSAEEQWDQWSIDEREVWATQINEIALGRHAPLALVEPTEPLPDRGLTPIAREPSPDEHPSFAQPLNPDIGVWRYSNVARLTSVLESSSLWFSRADLLGDPHEGARGPVNIARARETYGDSRLADQALSMNAEMRRRAFVSCWHASDYESHAMWSVYGGRGDSVAIRSTYGRLAQSLTATPQVQIGLVRYVDYSKTWIPEANAFDALMHKRKHFEHEREARVILFVDFSGDPALMPPGIEVPIDLPTLIVELVLAPGSPTSSVDSLRALAARVGLDVRARRSDLDAGPIF